MSLALLHEHDFRSKCPHRIEWFIWCCTVRTWHVDIVAASQCWRQCIYWDSTVWVGKSQSIVFVLLPIKSPNERDVSWKPLCLHGRVDSPPRLRLLFVNVCVNDANHMEQFLKGCGKAMNPIFGEWVFSDGCGHLIRDACAWLTRIFLLPIVNLEVWRGMLCSTGVRGSHE